MSTTTTRTNLEVRVNTQDIRKADRAIRQAFDPRAVKQLHTAVAQMTQAVEKMTRATGQLTASIKASANAGKGFQTLSTDLAKARQEAERLNREIARMQGRRPSGGFGGGGGGGGYGGGGPMGTTSGATAGLGGEARAPMPQIGMPSMQAAATALSAIPYLGLIAGGSLMASASYYGRAKADARSRQATFAMLGGSAQAKLGVMGARANAQADPAYVAQQLAAFDAAQAARQNTPQASSGGFMGFLGGLFGGSTPAPSTPSAAQIAAEREQVRAAALRTSAGLARRQAMATYYGAGGAGASDLTSMGMKYGLTMDAARQEASQLSQGAGFRVGAEQFGMAKSLQTAFGVDQGTTGGLMRAFRYMGEGGAEGANQQIANMLGTAIASGLDGSELAEHMQRQSQLLKQQLELGQQGIDMTALNTMTNRLSARVDPFMASKITTDFASAGARIGMQGAGSQEELLLAQAMGFGGGTESYMDTMMRMQDPSQVIQALPQVLRRVQRGGMSETAQTFFTQRLLKSFGVNVHSDTARQLVGLDLQGGEASTADIQSILQAGQLAPGTGLLAAEAGLDARRIEAGYKAGEQIRNLDSIMINMANSVQNLVGPALTELTGMLNNFSGAVNTFSGTAGGMLYGSGSGGASAGSP